jgi:hypothetical protein
MKHRVAYDKERSRLECSCGWRFSPTSAENADWMRRKHEDEAIGPSPTRRGW